MVNDAAFALAAQSFPSRFGTSWEALGAVLVATAAIYLVVIVAGRVLGLRSFAKMTAFDFAATVATGSILASTAAGSVPLAAGSAAIVSLFVVQWLIARVRGHRRGRAVVDNRPVLLAIDGRLIEDNMRAAMVQSDDLRAKMRKAGIRRREDLALAVLETSGDVSLISAGAPIEQWLTEDVLRDVGDRDRAHG